MTIARNMKKAPSVTDAAFALFLITSFTLLPAIRAVDPPPDGGYPAGNTAEGDEALLSLRDGVRNTAMGFGALRGNTLGSDNTANGNSALYSNRASG